MIELNTIYNEDCLNGLKKIDDKSINLVVTDPPYGINFNSNHRVKSNLKSVNGILNDKDNKEFLHSVAKELHRVLKDNSHLYFFTRWDKVDEPSWVKCHRENVHRVSRDRMIHRIGTVDSQLMTDVLDKIVNK